MPRIYYVTAPGWKWHVVIDRYGSAFNRFRFSLCARVPDDGWEGVRDEMPEPPPALCRACMETLARRRDVENCREEDDD